MSCVTKLHRRQVQEQGHLSQEALEGYAKGQNIKFKVLESDPEKERVSLGIKQLTADPFENVSLGVKKGDVVTCTVSAITEGGIEVTLSDNLTGFIRKGEL